MAKVISFAEEKRAREIAEKSVLEFEIYAVVKLNETEETVDIDEELLGGFTCKYPDAFKAFEKFLVQCMPYLIDNYAKTKKGLPLLELRSVKQREGKSVCAVFELLREEIPMKDFTYVKLTPTLVSVDWKEK